MKLLKSQLNSIFELIENSDLSPSQFAIDEEISSVANDPDEVTTVIYHKASDFFYKFETSPGATKKHYAIYSPAEEKLKNQ